MQQHLAALALAELTGVRDAGASPDTSDGTDARGAEEVSDEAPARHPAAAVAFRAAAVLALASRAVVGMVAAVCRM
ncbi:MAG: hypothetical protein LH616_06555 [Ilumatobacteraceae bacterium]|nr:hypothetical protein [Ilumatobacteraceae bacterium]